MNVAASPNTLAADYVVLKPSGFLSVNLFWALKKSPGLCKTNCRSIEVPILYPLLSFDGSYLGSFDLEDLEHTAQPIIDILGAEEALEHKVVPMNISQGHDLSPRVSSRSSTSASPEITTASTFPFLSLPFELRLKIYALLLPPRHHKVVTQLPHNGFFYNASTIPSCSAQSFYPLGIKTPNKLTTYKVLSSNFRTEYPSLSIRPAILGTSKQVHEEAQTVLYGNTETVWDFGVHLDACQAFWGDRGRGARALCRGLRVASEIPTLGNGKITDGKWVGFCEWLKNEMTGLRTLDLTVWSSSGSVTAFSSSVRTAASGQVNDDWQEKEVEMEMTPKESRKWKEWEWIHGLLQMEALRTARITYWGFENPEMKGDVETQFGSWLAGRMVSDKLLKDRVIKDGVIVEGLMILHGQGS